MYQEIGKRINAHGRMPGSVEMKTVHKMVKFRPEPQDPIAEPRPAKTSTWHPAILQPASCILHHALVAPTCLAKATRRRKSDEGGFPFAISAISAVKPRSTHRSPSAIINPKL